MSLQRDACWLIAALLFGLLVLPALVYVTGIAVLGAYAHGGLVGFLGDFFANLAHLRWFSWTLALGPVALVVLWRVVASRRPA